MKKLWILLPAIFAGTVVHCSVVSQTTGITVNSSSASGFILGRGANSTYHRGIIFNNNISGALSFNFLQPTNFTNSAPNNLGAPMNAIASGNSQLSYGVTDPDYSVHTANVSVVSGNLKLDANKYVLHTSPNCGGDGACGFWYTVSAGSVSCPNSALGSSPPFSNFTTGQTFTKAATGLNTLCMQAASFNMVAIDLTQGTGSSMTRCVWNSSGGTPSCNQ